MRGRWRCCIGCGLLLHREMTAHGQASEQLKLLLVCCRENTLCPVCQICPGSRDQPCGYLAPLKSTQLHFNPTRCQFRDITDQDPLHRHETEQGTGLRPFHSLGRFRCEDMMGILFSLCSRAVEEHNQTHHDL